MTPVFLFPGQGSQVVGMGKEFHDNHDEARVVFDAATLASGLDIRTLCFDGPIEALTETRNLQPAMTATVLACFRVFQKTNTMKPMFYSGHSLGEYAALAAAGVITDSDCIKLVTARGRLMQEQAEANPGAMAAVLKMETEKVAEIVDGLAAEHTICMANLNAPGQIVVSGTEESIDALQEAVKEARGRFSKLQVSGAWHSPLMKGAEAAFNEVIDSVDFCDANAPVLLNVTGAPETSGAVIKETMKLQMCTGVKWYYGIEHAWEQGARTFVEFGPKATLTKMNRYIVPNHKEQTIQLIDGEDSLVAWAEKNA